MAKYRLMGGIHEEGNRRFAFEKGKPGPIVESDRELDKMFRGHFTRVGEELQTVDPGQVIRRTKASELQDREGRNLGNNAPIATTPPDTFFDESHFDAQLLDDEEKKMFKALKENIEANRRRKAARLAAENAEAQQQHMESVKDGLTDKIDPASSKTLAGKAQAAEQEEAKPAKAQKASAKAQATEAEDEDEDEAEAEDEEAEEEEEQAEDVTDQFDAAEDLGYTVEKLDGTYYVKEDDEHVGRKSGYSTKKEVNALLKKQAAKAK